MSPVKSLKPGKPDKRNESQKISVNGDTRKGKTVTPKKDQPLHFSQLVERTGMNMRGISLKTSIDQRKLTKLKSGRCTTGITRYERRMLKRLFCDQLNLCSTKELMDALDGAVMEGRNKKVPPHNKNKEIPKSKKRSSNINRIEE